jgi:hypothetical protein
MNSEWLSATEWARQEFGSAALGDPRRTRRLQQMAATIAKAPSGRVSSVFTRPRELQAAYDFLEHDHVDAVEILSAAARAAAKRAAAFPYVFVPIDGSSLNLVDRQRSKGFGVIGSGERKTAGLKVISALAVDVDGAPIGILAQRYWARPDRKKAGRLPNHARPTETKETQRWMEVINEVHEICDSHDAKAWVQIDREGDARPLLTQLAQTGEYFTVRSTWNRRLVASDGRDLYMADEIRRCPVVSIYDVEVPANPHRQARLARFHIRAMSVVLRLTDYWTKKVTQLPVTVVEAREYGTTPSGERPLVWRLLTNFPVATDEDLLEVVRGYTFRWRIEDLHRSWKRGGCHVEDTQLRSAGAVQKWATILVVVASRLERLKHLARTQPDLSADNELSPTEIKALILLKRRQAKRTETITNDIPTIATAVQWIAELGGYTGKSSGGPPGAITIGRGLEKLRIAAEVLASLDDNPT